MKINKDVKNYSGEVVFTKGKDYNFTLVEEDQWCAADDNGWMQFMSTKQFKEITK